MVLFGGAVMAAAFMLGSAAEAAELDAPPGVAVAGVALVAVLPEYVIEVYFAFTGHVEFVTASLTGSTRLLLSVAVGMPAVVLLIRGARGRAQARLPVVELAPGRRVDLAIIAAASLYAPLIVVRGHLAWPDALVLIGLYVLYLRRISSGDPEPPHLVGVAAELGRLSKRQRVRWVLGTMAFSAVAVLITAEPFADATLMTGQAVGLSPYLLVQWLVPLATEAPELVVVATLVTLRVQHRDAVLMLALFALQVALPSTLIRAALTVVYLVLAVDILRDERWAARTLIASVIPGQRR
jgi:cation:H+ antiporter